jgi:L-ascorbate metabolism protein UlaG (beta-lactamase superfamily)
MIVPALSDDALLDDVRSASGQPLLLHLWWLGQSGFLVKTQGLFVLFDPYLSDSLTEKYASTDKPHVRMTELAVDPARLDFIDVVTSSHNHTDHLDGETLIPLIQANPNLTIVVPAANREFAAERLRVPIERLTAIDDGGTTSLGDTTIHAVPAAHDTVELDEQGRCRFLGYVAQVGNWTIYHSGDTLLYEGMQDRLRQWKIDVALLPINGRAPERRVAGNLWGREAAQLASDIGAKCVIPCHYDMFTFNTATPDEFVEECLRLRQDHRVLQCGERCTFPGDLQGIEISR